MATITELVNAIKGYVDNPTIGREILANQIKRAIRQICRKENNLHQDLVYLAEGAMDRDIGNLQQLRINAKNLPYKYCISEIPYNQNRLYEQYEKWKNKICNAWQNILNLQAQILALQNNASNQINMTLLVRFIISEFHDGEQNHDDFVDQFVIYINLANINNNTRIVNILDQAIKEEA
ncbi:hypothetical protein RhiirA4_480003 [Rhizophagus irregularis]|uniref:Uncharacterized protein n=1 Tax=Rhizophagus irregularis TaxID=588596 RepID=A0A2I1HH94_9GLOM|nr:hypothetical protein RhiirA4_480003 [Rhizophagus irregularis]